MKSERRRVLDHGELSAYHHIAEGVLNRVTLIRTDLLPRAADGMTLGRFVFLRGDRIEGGVSKLMAHELVHVRQFAELGPIRFVATYVREYLQGLFRLRSHRAAYLAISLEVEARREADEWADQRT